MSTSVVETPVEVLGSPPDEGGAVNVREQIIPDNPAQVFDRQPEEHEIVHETVPKAIKLERLTEKEENREFPEGKDAALYLHLSSVPAPIEKSIDIPSLLSKLSSLLPGDRQLERRAHKLAWNLSKGKRVTWGWDLVFFSELNSAESRMPNDEFVALYADQVKTPTKKGGRPRKYRTVKAQKEGHAERQRRYRERKLLVISDVTKTSSQLAER
jgi:hypothetical protein